MRHYLTVKTGEIPGSTRVYAAFKMHARSQNVANLGVEALVRDIREFASYFCNMALGSRDRPGLSQRSKNYGSSKVDVAYPFLLELYHDYHNGDLNKDEMLAVVRLVESYVFRRAVCAIPTNSMNKTFATFGKVLKKDRYFESILAHFLSLPSYRRFPNDDEFKRDVRLAISIIFAAGAIGCDNWRITVGKKCLGRCV